MVSGTISLKGGHVGVGGILPEGCQVLSEARLQKISAPLAAVFHQFLGHSSAAAAALFSACGWPMLGKAADCAERSNIGPALLQAQ